MRRISIFYVTAGLAITMAFLLVLLPACDEKLPLATPYFPVQSQPQEVLLQARLEGELVLDEEYLRIYDNLILWPYGYSVEVEGNDIWVVNDENERVVKVGDWVVIGGGVISAEFAMEKIGEDLPEGCTGPYWLGNPIVDEE